MYIYILGKHHFVRPDVDTKEVLFALSDAVESVFTERDWDKLATRVKGGELIGKDPRLLRSLYWGDDDYGFRVTHVIDGLIKLDPKNIQIIEELVKLESYLQKTIQNSIIDYTNRTW